MKNSYSCTHLIIITLFLGYTTYSIYIYTQKYDEPLHKIFIPPKSPRVESQMFVTGPGALFVKSARGDGPNFSGRVVQRSGQEDLCFSKALDFSCRQHIQKFSDV